MRILTVVHKLTKGGTERAAQTFAEAYYELNHDSRVLSLYGLGPRYDEIKDKLFVWDTLTPANLIEIAEWNPELIHIHSHGPRYDDIKKLIDGIRSLSCSIKIVETNVFSKPSPWADEIDISFQLSVWADWLFKMRGGGEYKSAIVPYPVKCNNFFPSNKNDTGTFKNRYKIPEEALIIGRIGQPYAGKWSPMLVSVFEKLAIKYQNLYLVVIGAPDSILTKLEKSPYHSRTVSIDSIIGDRELAIAYSSMDCMLHIAEQGESFGMVLAESILCGTPVITLSTPWGDNSQCEVVGNMKGGYVVSSSKGIIKAFDHCINNNYMHLIQEAGFRHIKENYNYLDVAKKALGSVYNEYTGSNTIQETDKLVNKIIVEAFDKASPATRILIKLNMPYSRLLTKYTSSYRPVSYIVKKIFMKSIINL